MNDDELLASLKPGSLAHQLWISSQAMTKIEPKPKAEKTGEPRQKIIAVEPGQGVSNLYSGSMRRKVMDWILAQSTFPVPIDLLEKEFGKTVRGHIQKLTVTGHLRVPK